MANEKSIGEINELISKIEAALEPNAEIGARDKTTLRALLKAGNINRKAKFFTCKRENSARVLSYFVKEKGIPQSKFSMNAQPDIFIVY
jgi:hypothetical protein